MNIITYLFYFSITTFFTLSSIILAQQPTQQTNLEINAATRAIVIQNLISELNDEYIFADKAKMMDDDLHERLKNKEYDSITSGHRFAEKLNEDLFLIAKDKHLLVHYSSEILPAREENHVPTLEEEAEWAQFIKWINYGFEKVERMEGNVGYIDLRGFYDPDSGRETVAAAMTFISNTDSLIFDLRHNDGGEPAMVALISSYLFGNEPIHLNDLFWRKENKTDEYWTNPKIAQKKYKKDIYVLVSSCTFSGGEEFAYNLKNLKRATIIGETTAGGANPGRIVHLSQHFSVFVPRGCAINPITKTNWEGTGVEPDIKVPEDQALKVAYLLALKNRSKQ